MKDSKPRLIKFEISDSTSNVVLRYSDGDTITVLRSDYKRAMGTMINSDKESVRRDYAVV